MNINTNIESYLNILKKVSIENINSNEVKNQLLKIIKEIYLEMLPEITILKKEAKKIIDQKKNEMFIKIKEENPKKTITQINKEIDQSVTNEPIDEVQEKLDILENIRKLSLILLKMEG